MKDLGIALENRPGALVLEAQTVDQGGLSRLLAGSGERFRLLLAELPHPPAESIRADSELPGDLGSGVARLLDAADHL